MQKIKIFLASSSELKSDREQFEIFMYRECKKRFDDGVFLHLDIWEDFLDAMSATGLQSEYNKAIQDCDIFVLLAWNKVGKYTAEEFEKAFGSFEENQKPFIFTYFKPHTTRDRDELKSLWEFEDKLNELKHYKTPYETIEGLREHFGNQLDKLAKNGFEQLGLSAAITDDGAAKNSQTGTVTDNRKIYNIEKIDQAEFS
ncbi:hypothetical protein [[Limnothrix rosea] IAM M-220]|uniref:hypothetical protein n=1 Tax=[Limnothrix rosea] IAM M-220 TaxID=454133 RepID=UPI000969A0A7|nr:hypothetical protein [[Limnothrix rosea] IAM M-220]OKH14579.1 hypothetical protein NIES208_13835 [[Limnothrix rosea] IAM M-220]